MQSIKSLSKGTLALLVAGVLLLVLGGVGTARAALNPPSNTLVGSLALNELGVALQENGVTVEGDDTLIQNLTGDGSQVVLGKTYDEALSVVNETETPEYVRVIIQKYWKNADGTKDTSLDPSLIELNLLTDGWTIDTSASTAEQTVLYLNEPLAANASAQFADTLTVDPELTLALDDEMKAEYASHEIGLTATVEAVQTDNYSDASKVVWGIDAPNAQAE